jgi:hypothetical protein
MIWKQVDMTLLMQHQAKIDVLIDGIVEHSADEFTKEQVINSVGKSHQAWAYFHGETEDEIDTLAITTAVQYPDKLAMVVVGCYGDRKDQPWKDVINGINAIANKFYEADVIEVKGRKAFAKIWGDEGFTEKYRTIERAVQEVPEIGESNEEVNDQVGAGDGAGPDQRSSEQAGS